MKVIGAHFGLGACTRHVQRRYPNGVTLALNRNTIPDLPRNETQMEAKSLDYVSPNQ